MTVLPFPNNQAEENHQKRLKTCLSSSLHPELDKDSLVFIIVHKPLPSKKANAYPVPGILSGGRVRSTPISLEGKLLFVIDPARKYFLF